MIRTFGCILALVASAVSATAHAQMASTASFGGVHPNGQWNDGGVGPLTIFQNDTTLVAAGKLSDVLCISDISVDVTCGATISHRLAPGFDPKQSDVVLGGFRITKISGGTLKQGMTYRLGAEVEKSYYDAATGDFEFFATLDFGPTDQPAPSTFIGELEYWIVLSTGAHTWSKQLDTTCTGDESCAGSASFFKDEIPRGMVFMSSALQMFSMYAKVDSPDQIQEFGIDASRWNQGLVYVYDPSSGKLVEKPTWQVDPACRFIAQTPGLWKGLVCRTRSLAFAADDGWFETAQASTSVALDASKWEPAIQLTIPNKARGVFTGVNAFDVKYTDPVPAQGNTEVRAGCFRPSVNPPMGSVQYEALMSDGIPPTAQFQGQVSCLTGWLRTP